MPSQPESDTGKWLNRIVLGQGQWFLYQRCTTELAFHSDLRCQIAIALTELQKGEKKAQDCDIAFVSQCAGSSFKVTKPMLSE